MHGFAVEQLRQQNGDANGRGHSLSTVCVSARLTPNAFAQISPQHRFYRFCVGKAGVIKAVEVELEGLAFDDVGRVARHGKVGQRHLRFAAQIEPAQLKSGPHVGTHERGRACNADLGTLARAGNGKQQGGVVLVDVVRGFAELGVFWMVHDALLSIAAQARIKALIA